MHIPKLSNSIFMVLGLILSCLGVYFYDGYSISKKRGENTTYFGYVKNRSSQIYEGIKIIPQIAQDAQKSGDDITMGSLEKVRQALFMYSMDNARYPDNIEELLGAYLKEDDKIIRQNDFFYIKTASGYKMGARLPLSNKIYSIEE